MGYLRSFIRQTPVTEILQQSTLCYFRIKSLLLVYPKIIDKLIDELPLGIVMTILTTMKKNSIRVPCSLVLPYTKEYCSIGPKYQHIIFLSDLVEIWPLFTIKISVWDPNFVQ